MISFKFCELREYEVIPRESCHVIASSLVSHPRPKLFCFLFCQQVIFYEEDRFYRKDISFK